MLRGDIAKMNASICLTQVAEKLNHFESKTNKIWRTLDETKAEHEQFKRTHCCKRVILGSFATLEDLKAEIGEDEAEFMRLKAARQRVDFVFPE